MNIHETERTFHNIPQNTGITNSELLFVCYCVDTIYVWNILEVEISSTISRDYKYVSACKRKKNLRELDLNIENKLCTKC